MNYGKALRILRVSRGISQKELAQRTEIDPSYISLVEKGTRTPSTSILEKCADALGIPMYLLMLLGSEKEDLRGLTDDEADRLGGRLLRILVDSPLERPA